MRLIENGFNVDVLLFNFFVLVHEILDQHHMSSTLACKSSTECFDTDWFSTTSDPIVVKFHIHWLVFFFILHHGVYSDIFASSLDNITPVILGSRCAVETYPSYEDCQGFLLFFLPLVIF